MRSFRNAALFALLCLVPACLIPAVVHGQLNPRRTSTIATGETPVEHQHLMERILPPETGIVVEPIYYGEVFSNTRGGISTRQATKYQGLLDLAMALDLDKLRLPVPGTFAMVFQNSHGRGLTVDYVGDAQVLSNIDSFDNVTQVGEYWWQFPLCDNAVTVRLGKQDVNTEFLVVDMASDFVQSGFGLSPALAVPTFPDQSFAALLLINLTDQLQWKFGVWDGLPNGRNWGFSGTALTFTIGELQYDYAICCDTLRGSLDVGIGYLSDGLVDGAHQRQSWAYYFQWEQALYRENAHDPKDTQGFGIFFQYGAGRDAAEVEFPEYFGAGIVFYGPVPGRDDDTLGIGLARAKLDGGGTGRESAIELFYKAKIRSNLYLQPDLQYIATPSGIHPDSLVVGTRFETIF